MKKFTAIFLSLGLTMCLCSCGVGATPSADNGSPAGAETAEEAAAMTENETADVKEYPATLPEDNGDMIGVYKWVEMADNGINAYLVIWDGGIGIIDMLGVVETVRYDDDTMQSSGEGALPQSYTYEDGTLTWTAIGDDEGQVSTFVKLAAEELAEYQAKGIGNAE